MCGKHPLAVGLLSIFSVVVGVVSLVGFGFDRKDAADTSQQILQAENNIKQSIEEIASATASLRARGGAEQEGAPALQQANNKTGGRQLHVSDQRSKIDEESEKEQLVRKFGTQTYASDVVLVGVKTRFPRFEDNEWAANLRRTVEQHLSDRGYNVQYFTSAALQTEYFAALFSGSLWPLKEAKLAPKLRGALLAQIDANCRGSTIAPELKSCSVIVDFRIIEKYADTSRPLSSQDVGAGTSNSLAVSNAVNRIIEKSISSVDF
jgi:hypothetical protein